MWTRQTVGPLGGVVSGGPAGAPAPLVEVSIPPGALTRELEMALAGNAGRIQLASGVSSGHFIRLSAERVRRFELPVQLKVRFDAAKWKGFVPVGYAIDEGGRLASIDAGEIDWRVGAATFVTFRPILFTWVYVRVP